MSDANDNNQSLNMQLSCSRETTSSDFVLVDSGKSVVNEAPATFVRRVYIAPLRSMPDDGNHTFIVLLLTLALYEKHARCLYGFRDNFYGEHQFFDRLSSDLGTVSPKDAALFWRQFRHGVFHRAFPKSESGYRFQTSVAQAVTLNESRAFVVNPFALRELLLPIIEANLAYWDSDPESPLPKTIE